MSQATNPMSPGWYPTMLSWETIDGVVGRTHKLRKGDPNGPGSQYPMEVIADPANCIDAAGKPIFDVSGYSASAITEKEMSDHEKMAWKNYLLWRSTLKIDRRDTVFEALASGDIPALRMSQHWMGTPFPVIEPHPYWGELFFSIRWYEHATSLAVSMFYYMWIKAKPNIRYTGNAYTIHKNMFTMTFIMMEFNWGYRSMWRLQGQTPNEAECYKYGICETPERLRQKAIYWKKFRDYKEEWMKRWDFYAWGIRPGERYKLHSACLLPPWPVRFNTKTDYPVRKNPFFLSTDSLRDIRLDTMLNYRYTENADTPLERTRPEVKYIWRGGVA